MPRESQCGFFIGWGCVDQNFTLRILAEKAMESNTSASAVLLLWISGRPLTQSTGKPWGKGVLEKRYHLPGKFFHILTVREGCGIMVIGVSGVDIIAGIR